MKQYKYEKNKLTKTIVHEYTISDKAIKLLEKFLQGDEIPSEYIYENNLNKELDELRFSGIVKRKEIINNLDVVLDTYYVLSKCHKVEDLQKLIFEDDLSYGILKMFQDQKLEREEFVKNATEWHNITCPHCKTEYRCTPHGVGTHCYDYLTVDLEELVGGIETGELQCPKCKKYFKDPI